jgi:putative spermidine/putrescine transport system permease protein
MARDLSRSDRAAAGIDLRPGEAAARLAAAPRRQPRVGRFVLAVASGAVLLFLCLPIAVVVPMSFSSASSLEFPPPGLSLRWYESFFGDPRWIRAAGTSALVALASSIAALILGSVAAYGLVRGSLRGRALLEGNFIAPLILPPVITAVALYIFFAKIGLLGTMPGLIAAHTILTVPYVVLLMSVAIRQFDVRIEQVAYSLGASWFRMFKSVLLPNLLPSVLAAWIFAFIISFDEVIVTLFLAGSYDTIPKRMFNELILQVNPTTTAIATLLIALSVVTIAVVAWLMQRAGVLGHTLG